MSSDENYKRLRAELDDRLKSDQRLKALAEKISAGTADLTDTAKYSQIVSHILGDVISKNIGEIKVPLGKELVCKELLKDHYDMINGVIGKVQASVDEKLGIHLSTVKAPFPTERVDKAAHSLEDPTVPEETIKRRARSATENIANSMHDDTIKENAKRRSKAGLDTYLVRNAGGGCCKWCQALEGRYKYAEAPDDIFRRHDNCTCTVTYECGRQRQDVWSKRTWQASEKELQQRREAAEAAKPVKISPEQAKIINEQSRPRVNTPEQAKIINEQSRPRVNTPEQAKELKAEVLAKRRERLTGEAKSGIIETVSNQQDFMDREHKEQLSRYVYDPKTGGRTLEEWSFRSNPLGEYPNIFSQTYSQDARAMAEYLNEKVNNGDYGDLDRIVIAKSKSLKGISSYDYAKNTLYISEELITQEGFDRLVDSTYFPAQNLDDVIIHELDGHKRHWDNVKKFYSDNKDKYPKLEDAKQDYERRLREYVVKEQAYNRFFISDKVSYNSYDDFTNKSSLNELLADCSVHYRANNITDDILFELVKDVMRYDG